MLFWFLGASSLLVFIVFDSIGVDYRLVMIGSLLPWIDVLWGPPWPLHSVLFPVAVMLAVAMILWGNRLQQRRWIGLVIGSFFHLLLAGAWTDRDMFWWPVFGLEANATKLGRSPTEVVVAMEVAGVLALVWLYRAGDLGEARRRRRFVETGQLYRTGL